MCDEEVLDAVRERHADLGSTFAREKLVEVHGHLKKGAFLNCVDISESLAHRINRKTVRLRSPNDTHLTRTPMKADIHPDYTEVTATCSCGNVIKTRSTLGSDLHLDVCSSCHPFYTGKQKIVDSGGRVERFNRRFAGLSAQGR